MSNPKEPALKKSSILGFTQEVKIAEKSSKHFPSSIREWKNSIYVYNKYALNSIPVITTSVYKEIKSYFSLFNNNLERKMRSKRLLVRLRRLSSNKIYISNGEFKHTNNKVIITLYLFNRQKHNYQTTLDRYIYKICKIYKRKKLYKTLSLIKFLKKAKQNKYILIKILDKITNNRQLYSYKTLTQYITKYIEKLQKNSLKHLNYYIYYKQLIHINKSKFNYTYLQYLTKYLEKIYNKNVEFNLVNLKHFYLNSDILSESITLKLTRNRRKILRHLNILKRKVKTNKKQLLLHVPFLKKNHLIKQNLSSSFLKKHIVSLTSSGLATDRNKRLHNFVLTNLKYRHVTGFRLEATGRLTRRYTASRSVSKLRYKGNLLNIDSSFRGLSSVLLKGNLRSNVQFTKFNSQTRIGSFGIKGWVSGN